MADNRFTFPQVDAGYNPYLLYQPAVYDQNLVSAEEFLWTGNEEQDFDLLDALGDPYYEPENEHTNLQPQDPQASLSSSAPSQLRARAWTGESQQSFEGVGSSAVNGNWAAKLKQKQRRQDAKELGQFRCEFKDCPRHERPFGSSSDRRRHLAESHAVDPKGAFQLPRPCPWPQCARAQKNFKRQRNLEEHLTKKHSGQRPDHITESKTSTGLTSVGAEVPLLKSEDITSTTPTARSLVASPQLRARRLDRAKRREDMKRRIASLKETGDELASDIAVVRVEFDEIKNRLNSMEEAEKACIQLLRNLNERLADGELEDEVLDTPTDAPN